MRIKSMIEREIDLREHHDLNLCLLAVCPNSEAVLEAAVKVAARNACPMLFAATLNQVDCDGGYTGWTPAQFVGKLDAFAAQYHADRDTLFPCLDHGGPWLKDVHTLQHLSFEATFQAVKHSITAMLEAGYQLLHIDPTVDRTLDGPLPVALVVERSLDLIAYAEAERVRLGLPPISYEVGTEEVHGGLVDLANFEAFLSQLYAGLAERHLEHAAPAFVVAQVGTDLHTTAFDRVAAERLYPLVAPHGTLIKGHYSDWVDNPEDYGAAGMGGANVGPEFTAAEFDALQDLARRESDLARIDPALSESRFFEQLAAAVDASNRWKKWLQPEEQGLKLGELSLERHLWMLKTGARYVWTAPDVVAARERLYANLSPIMGDPHQVVVDRIAAAIERYVVAFHLFDAVALFEG